MHFLLIYISIGLPYVVGHGFVHNVVVGGQSYPGWNPFTDPYVVWAFSFFSFLDNSPPLWAID